MQLAGYYGDNGVGVIIVNSEVTEANWVVEPSTKKRESLTAEEVLFVFNERLPTVLRDSSHVHRKLKWHCMLRNVCLTSIRSRLKPVRVQVNHLPISSLLHCGPKKMMQRSS